MQTAPLRVGYVVLHMTSYFAETHGVFSRARTFLDQLERDTEIVVVHAPQLVVERSDAALAREFFSTRDVDLLLVQFATCSTSDPVLELAEMGIPMLLWAVPEPSLEGPIQLNSFVALQIAASTLHQRARDRGEPSQYKCVWGETNDEEFRQPLLVTLRALRARRALRESRVGLIGDVAPGFVNLSFVDEDIRERVGPEIHRHDVNELLGSDVDENEVNHVASEMWAAAREVNVPRHDVVRSARAYLNLRRIAYDGRYDALAVRDWPELQERANFSPLLAMAWLSEREQIPVACEGDVLGAVAMIALSSISHSMTTLLDMGPANLSGDELLLWHLGSSPHGFANDEGVTYEYHSTLGRNGAGPFGVVVDQAFGPGPVTLTNLSDSGRTLFVAGGRLTGASNGPSGDHGWVVDTSLNGETLNIANLLATALTRGVTHHCAMVRGDWQRELLELASWTNLRVVPASAKLDARLPGTSGGEDVT